MLFVEVRMAVVYQLIKENILVDTFGAISRNLVSWVLHSERLQEVLAQILLLILLIFWQFIVFILLLLLALDFVFLSIFAHDLVDSHFLFKLEVKPL